MTTVRTRFFSSNNYIEIEKNKTKIIISYKNFIKAMIKQSLEITIRSKDIWSMILVFNIFKNWINLLLNNKIIFQQKITSAYKCFHPDFFLQVIFLAICHLPWLIFSLRLHRYCQYPVSFYCHFFNFIIMMSVKTKYIANIFFEHR